MPLSVPATGTIQAEGSDDSIFDTNCRAILDTPADIGSTHNDSDIRDLPGTGIIDFTLFDTHMGPSTSENSYAPLQLSDWCFSPNPHSSLIHDCHVEASASNLSGGHIVSGIGTQLNQLLLPLEMSTVSATDTGLDTDFSPMAMSPRTMNAVSNLSKEVALRMQLTGQLPSATISNVLSRGN